jgi:hypothetical protein
MVMRFRLGPISVMAALLFLSAGTASAQGVKLEFVDGLVNLSTQNASARAILAEWARLGGTTIVGGDRVVGAPLTVELVGVPERTALDVILREVPGYMLAARRDEKIGASRFDRIMVVPVTATPRPAPATTFTSAPQPFAPNPFGERDDIEERAEQDARRAEELQRARDEAMRRVNEAVRAVTPGVVLTRPDAPPPPYDADGPPTPTAPPGRLPSNPFMPTPGSSTPGTIAPVPQQQQQPQNGQRPVQ